MSITVGTHGHMKCVFDSQLKAQDTILMNLYKRVYPKWTYSGATSLPMQWGDGKNQSTLKGTCINRRVIFQLPISYRVRCNGKCSCGNYNVMYNIIILSVGGGLMGRRHLGRAKR